MQVIEEKLHAIHAEARKNRPVEEAMESDESRGVAVKGFLVVTEVTPSSPAAATVCACVSARTHVCVHLCVHACVPTSALEPEAAQTLPLLNLSRGCRRMMLSASLGPSTVKIFRQ